MKGVMCIQHLRERGPLRPWGQRARASALTSLLGSMRPGENLRPAATLRKTSQKRPEIDDFGPIFDDSGTFLGR